MNEPTSSVAAASSSTTLRPRNRRRTQNEDERSSNSPAKPAHRIDAPFPPVSSSRAASPLPRPHPSRPIRIERHAERPRNTGRALGVSNILETQTNPSTFATGLWESSWSSIQGIAATLIGNDTSQGSSPRHSLPRRRRQLEVPDGINTSTPSAQWGPSGGGSKQLGSGTREDRWAQMQAKKREKLLAAAGHTTPDASGRYKRRDSDERNRASVPPGEDEDRDALVYLHKVKPQDTLQGVLIKYNCQSNMFRKANRLWPNDSIQIRTIVVLPVEACGVRGRKIPETYGTLSNGGNIEDIIPTPTTLHPPWGAQSNATEDKETPLSSIPTSPSISVSLSNSDEPPWRHDSWVIINGFTDAVEIARISRKTLGFFPRSRRKSMTFSDLETPPASFDLPRASYQSTSPRRQQSETKSRSSSGSYFANQLHGPGGVGTMSSNVRSPGPAQDGLNKLFAAHLPNLAPRSSFESVHSSSSHGNGIENVGGAIEGWVRKLAWKASTSLQPPTPGGRSGVGDLIELSEDAFELEDDSPGENGGRRSTITSANAGSGVGAWSAEQERLLHERFPPGGRVFAESAKKGKAKESDLTG